MSDIPSDLHLQILLHLPADSLLRFRSVCKAWRRIIDDPSFVKSHTINRHSSAATHLLIRDSTFFRLYSLPLHSLTRHAAADLTRIKNLVRRGVPHLTDLPTTSCRGLILLSHCNKDWVVWNPFMREYSRLSEPLFHVSTRLEGVGFGYDHASDDYRVVRIGRVYCENDEFVFRTLVYSLKSGTWRAIGDCPLGTMLWPGFGVCLNGALYWMCETAIMALDLESEVYRLLPLPAEPPPPPPPLADEAVIVYLDALDGCLFVSYYYVSERLDVWVMEDERSVETKWIKLVSFEEDDDDVAMIFRPVAYLKRNREVIVRRDDHFYCFDVEGNSVKKVTVDGLPECFSCQSFEGSLFRLVGDGDGDDDGSGAAGVRRRGRKRGQRLKLSVAIDDLTLRFKHVL